jgi:hypothetical protein
VDYLTSGSSAATRAKDLSQFSDRHRLPLASAASVSLWGYAQAAKIVDNGRGWAFPGLRMVVGPLEVGAEYRQYYKRFRGDFFNYVYEIERVQFKDSMFVTKERTLQGLSTANGYYADALMSFVNVGYLFAWYQDMRGKDYPGGTTLYGEAGITPPQVTRLQKVAVTIWNQRNSLCQTRPDGQSMAGCSLACSKCCLVWHHRITYYNGSATALCSRDDGHI